jgi:predicted GH43/DUF377 family glycosyl hydrolase
MQSPAGQPNASADDGSAAAHAPIASQVTRTGLLLPPVNSRVVYRPFEPPSPQRSTRIIGRIMELSEDAVESLLQDVLNEFHGRHQRLLQFFLERYEAMRHLMLTDRSLSESRKLLIGSFFTQEYALESASLSNPAMVWHPDQSGLSAGTRRFVLSLRAIGEGHISSVVFRAGTVDAAGIVSVNTPTGFVASPRVLTRIRYEKALFRTKLEELGIVDGIIELAFAGVEDRFTLDELETTLARLTREHKPRRRDFEPYIDAIRALARSNYEIECDPASDISERIIFPYSPTETNGIEDARFVRFVEDDGSVHYYGTYTAFDGHMMLPQFVETDDFVRFRMSTLNGPEIANKGMAMFPRRINGHYCMLSRQDGENIYVMASENRHFWHTKKLVLRPSHPWQYVQIGNCGSPIETPAGWLVITHGVGPMRKYSIGAALLDLDDPTKVLGRLPTPLLSPMGNERSGYVPNVVYSCGGLVHEGLLVIPYAMSDYATTFATVPLQAVLDAMMEPP